MAPEIAQIAQLIRVGCNDPIADAFLAIADRSQEMSDEVDRLRAQLDRANGRIEIMHTLRSRMQEQLDRATEPREVKGRFLADDGQGEREEFSTQAEAHDWAVEQLRYYRKEAESQGEWIGEAEDVAVWGLVESVREVKQEHGVDFVLEPCALATKPRPMSDAAPLLKGNWADCGLTTEAAFKGARVRYHPCRGEHEYRIGTVRMDPWRNINKLWVTHVDLDDGDTIHSAYLEHLAVELLPTSSGGDSP